MNRALGFRHLSRTLLKQHQQVRHGGGAPTYVTARWSNIYRMESNLVTPDNPPTAPLSDDHEVGDGQSDFSKYYDNHDDVSTLQVVTGLGSGLLFFYMVYLVSRRDHDNSTPVFTIRESPTLEQDIPTMDHSVKRGPYYQEALNKAAEGE